MSWNRLDKEHCDRHFVKVGQNREALSAKLESHRDSLSLPPACAPEQGCHANPWRLMRDWDPVALVQGVERKWKSTFIHASSLPHISNERTLLIASSLHQPISSSEKINLTRERCISHEVVQVREALSLLQALTSPPMQWDPWGLADKLSGASPLITMSWLTT